MLVKRYVEGGGNDMRTVYRPCTLDEFLGNQKTTGIIRQQLITNDLSHTLLITGPSGCGKTTLARIIALSLNCLVAEQGQDPCLACANCEAILSQNSLDYMEINAAADSGKADTEAVVHNLSAAPFSADHRVIVFDECHELSKAARELLLKKMEDTYAHVYLIFCTNKPEKLVDSKTQESPFLDRCSKIALKPLSQEEIFIALENICQYEGFAYSTEVLDYVSELSKGIPRKALNLISTVISGNVTDLKSAKTALSDVLLEEDDPDIIVLSTTMLKGDYKKSFELFTKLTKKYPVETIRVAVAGFFVYQMKIAKDINRVHAISKVLDHLNTPIYSTGKPSEHIFCNYIAKAAVILPKYL